MASKKKVDLIVTGAKGMGQLPGFCLVASRRRWFSRVTARCWWSAEAGWSRALSLWAKHPAVAFHPFLLPLA